MKKFEEGDRVRSVDHPQYIGTIIKVEAKVLPNLVKVKLDEKWNGEDQLLFFFSEIEKVPELEDEVKEVLMDEMS